MSRINFADFASKRPDLMLVWDEFARWLSTHPRKRIIEPQALARAFPKSVAPSTLMEACGVMADSGVLRRAFMVESRNGQLIGEPYERIQDIPDTLPGEFESLDHTEFARIVAVFVQEAAGDK